jgi:WYL_2, Sm-like SH3 beta-barrel fold
MTLYVEFNNEVKPTIDMLRYILYANICEVTFTKVNGDLRTMPCTLKPELLPQQVVVEGEEKKERKVSDKSLAVWVTDIGEWRSFRLDSIHSISVK